MWSIAFQVGVACLTSGSHICSYRKNAFLIARLSEFIHNETSGSRWRQFPNDRHQRV